MISIGYAIKASTSLQNRDIFTFSQTLQFIKNRKKPLCNSDVGHPHVLCGTMINMSSGNTYYSITMRTLIDH